MSKIPERMTYTPWGYCPVCYRMRRRSQYTGQMLPHRRWEAYSITTGGRYVMPDGEIGEAPGEMMPCLGVGEVSIEPEEGRQKRVLVRDTSK
jgi:hypothetical protein